MPDPHTDDRTHEQSRLTTAHSAVPYKVLGAIDDPDGIGVLGHATATTGTPVGVEGLADSAADATGVLGRAPRGEADAVIGIAANGGLGVGAATDAPTQPGLLALNTATTGVATAVHADTGSHTDRATAVHGVATAATGRTYGVVGTTTSPMGYGFYTPDDAKLDGVTELTTLAGSLTDATPVTTLAGPGLAIDATGQLTAPRYHSHSFTQAGTTWTPLTDLAAPSLVEVTVDATPASAGTVNVDVDDTEAFAVAAGTQATRFVEPQQSVAVRTADAATVDHTGSTVADEPVGVTFDPDGFRMYVAAASGAIEQYSLDAAWTVTSPVRVAVHDGSAQVPTPAEIAISDDGTTLFVGGTDTIAAYTLSTAWDLATATHDTSRDVTSEDTALEGLTVDGTGTRLVTTGAQHTAAYAYTLSTAWDLATATFDDSVDLSPTVTDSPEGVTLTADGTTMYVTGWSTLYTYQLGTAWDITTATFFDADPLDAPATHTGATLDPADEGLFTTAVDATTGTIVAYTLAYDGTAYASVTTP